MEEERYKLIGLQVDGIRKLRAIDMKFAPNGLIKVVGQNRAGKTSILESIAILIEGKKMLKDGAINPDVERATIVGQVGDFTIAREYREGKDPVLKVTKKDGEILKGGRIQDWLSTFINNLSISPFIFMQKTPLEKLRFLMELYGIDFSAIDKQLTLLEADRLFTGRKIKEFGVLIEPERVEKVNMDALMAKRKDITDKNQVLRDEWNLERQGKKKEIDQYNEVMRSRSGLISRLKATAENILERSILLKNNDPVNTLHAADIVTQVEVLSKLHGEILKAVDQLPQVEPEKVLDLFAVPEPQYYSLADIDEQIQMSNATNLKAGIYQTHLNRVAEKQNLTIEYQDLDQQIEDLRNQKIAILAAIDTRVEGLEIKIDSVVYNKIDTENLSDAENMTLSLKLCAAMAPTLKAIFIDRGESFDHETQQVLHNWAIENDIQLIVSIVDEIPEEKEDGCFYIVEGQLV